MSEFPEDTRFLPGEAENGPYENADEMFQRDLESEGKPQGWKNVLVFAVAGVFAAVFLFWGTSMFRTSPKRHFLVGVKMTDPQPLLLLRSEEKEEEEFQTLRSSDLDGKTVVVFMWSPWDTASLNALAAVKDDLFRIQKKDDVRLISITYFETFTSTQDVLNPTVSPREEKLNLHESVENLTPEQKLRLQEERKKSFEQRKEALLSSVNRTFLSLNLKFDNVWWDPTDEFRRTQILLASGEARNKKVPIGMGVPTCFIVREGIITYVSTGFSSESIRDLKAQLAPLLPPEGNEEETDGDENPASSETEELEEETLSTGF